MDEFELEQLRRHPQWVAVLELYQQLFTQNREKQPQSDGWVPRIQNISEIPIGDLSGIHGKLIAFGFLKFDVAGRDEGIRYQLTPLGKQGINHSVPTESEESAIPVDRQLESVGALLAAAQ